MLHTKQRRHSGLRVANSFNCRLIAFNAGQTTSPSFFCVTVKIGRKNPFENRNCQLYPLTKYPNLPAKNFQKNTPKDTVQMPAFFISKSLKIWLARFTCAFFSRHKYRPAPPRSALPQYQSVFALHADWCKAGVGPIDARFAGKPAAFSVLPLKPFLCFHPSKTPTAKMPNWVLKCFPVCKGYVHFKQFYRGGFFRVATALHPAQTF